MTLQLLMTGLRRSCQKTINRMTKYHNSYARGKAITPSISGGYTSLRVAWKFTLLRMIVD